MNENAPSSKKIALNNGVIIGFVLIFYSLLLWVLGVDQKSMVQYFSIVFEIVGVILAVKYYREKNNGFLSYGQAFSNGFLTLLFAGILSSIYILLFFQVIAPDEVQKMITTAEEQMVDKNPNLTEEQIELAMKYTTMFMKPWAMALMSLFFNVLISLGIAAIVAAFMKKEEEKFV